MSRGYVRKFVRKYIDFPVRLIWMADVPRAVACQARNFGAGGLGMECPVELQTGQIVEIEFVLPGEKRAMRLNANVRMVEKLPQDKNGFRIGLQFIHVAPADQIYFTNYMAGTFLLY